MVLIHMCPCGSKQSYLECCGRFIESVNTPFPCFPETPEALMRSRFTAYVVKNAAYIVQTDHPSRRESGYEADIEASFQYITFTALKILHVELPEYVTFCAYFTEHDLENPLKSKQGKMIERSRFIHLLDHSDPLNTTQQGRWFYLDGQFPTQKQPCVCGRTKKFKQCCGKNI